MVHSRQSWLLVGCIVYVTCSVTHTGVHSGPYQAVVVNVHCRSCLCAHTVPIIVLPAGRKLSSAGPSASASASVGGRVSATAAASNSPRRVASAVTVAPTATVNRAVIAQLESLNNKQVAIGGKC